MDQKEIDKRKRNVAFISGCLCILVGLPLWVDLFNRMSNSGYEAVNRASTLTTHMLVFFLFSSVFPENPDKKLKRLRTIVIISYISMYALFLVLMPA